MSKRPRVPSAANEMLPEYDFTRGVRGKHYQAYQCGHTVRIRKRDGTTVVQHFKLEEGAVVIAPDVRQYFPDADTVNQALRTLIRLIPRKSSRADRT